MVERDKEKERDYRGIAERDREIMEGWQKNGRERER